MSQKIYYIHGLKAAPEVGIIAPLQTSANIKATCLAYYAENSWEHNWQYLLEQTQEADASSLFIGISMGGFFAAHLAAHLGAYCYLANPVISPALQLQGFVGKMEAGGRDIELTKDTLNSYLHAPDPRLPAMEKRMGLIVAAHDSVVDPAHALIYFEKQALFTDTVDDTHPLVKQTSIDCMVRRLSAWELA